MTATKKTARKNTRYALLGWTPVKITGVDTETGLLLVEDMTNSLKMLVGKHDILPLRVVKPANVSVIVNDEIVDGQIEAITDYDGNNNRWAVVVAKDKDEVIVAHFSRVLVG